MTSVGGAFGVRNATRRGAHGRAKPAVRMQSRAPADRPANLWVMVLSLAGVLVPSEVQLSLGAGARFTAGRLAVVLLFVPALIALCQKGRRFLFCDILACLTAAWMIIATLSSEGERALSSAGGDVLDFVGGYFIARGFCFGRPALDTFVRVLRVFTPIAIVLGMADRASGRYIVHETISALVHASSWPQAGLRDGVVRAASTFDHAILFGVFCALTGAILLYWERTMLRRVVAVAICFLGCMLSLSSGSLMALFIAISAYTYDRFMRRFWWRWAAFWGGIGAFMLAFVLASANPMSWIISHLTLDPQTGYFRIMIWQTASAYIALSPTVGYGYESLNNNIVSSVDSIWLLHALRFGMPMLGLFFLMNISALLPRSRAKRSGSDDYADRMSTAFSLVIFLFMFTGLTVDFWNYTWMFWGQCIGIRASLRELSLATKAGTRS